MKPNKRRKDVFHRGKATGPPHKKKLPEQTLMSCARPDPTWTLQLWFQPLLHLFLHQSSSVSPSWPGLPLLLPNKLNCTIPPLPLLRFEVKLFQRSPALGVSLQDLVLLSFSPSLSFILWLFVINASSTNCNHLTGVCLLCALRKLLCRRASNDSRRPVRKVSLWISNVLQETLDF